MRLSTSLASNFAVLLVSGSTGAEVPYLGPKPCSGCVLQLSEALLAEESFWQRVSRQLLLGMERSWTDPTMAQQTALGHCPRAV